MQEVGPRVFFALLVITVSFLPIFALEETEGRLFKPLAFTKTYAMGFAAMLSVTLTPALAALLDPRPHPRRGATSRAARARCASTAGRAPGRAPSPWRSSWPRCCCSPRTIPIVARLGSEFMPPLNEGTLLYMPIGAARASR